MIEATSYASFNPELRPEPGVALAVRDLRKSYDGTEILHGISLDIPEGELTLIKGESGSGKSTLLKCITGLETIDQGQVACGDVRLHRHDMDDRLADVRRKTFGYVFQSPSLQGGLSIEQNIRFPYEIEGIELDDEWVRYVCERVGIQDKLNEEVTARQLNTSWLSKFIKGGRSSGQRTTSLSGGEQQRVAIARALAHKPKLLVADEPTGSLDSANKIRIHELFDSLVKEDGLTVVMVSHDAVSQEYAETKNIITLQDGRVVG